MPLIPLSMSLAASAVGLHTLESESAMSSAKRAKFQSPRRSRTLLRERSALILRPVALKLPKGRTPVVGIGASFQPAAAMRSVIAGAIGIDLPDALIEGGKR